MLDRKAMELREAFIRDVHGCWTCIRPIRIHAPNGVLQVTPGTRFAPGTEFAGFRFQEWLDEHCRARL